MSAEEKPLCFCVDPVVRSGLIFWAVYVVLTPRWVGGCDLGGKPQHLQLLDRHGVLKGHL